jgi:thiosulfate/3-mercaptopyruvate sulfurtransferase
MRTRTSSFVALAMLCGAFDARAEETSPRARWPSAFVNVTTAQARIARDRVSVIDTRSRTDVMLGRIPGAMHMDWTETREGTFVGGRLVEDTDALARAFASRGVDGARPVLVCGDGVKGWGEEARVAWTLRVLGHDDVAFLDGGCVAWRDAGHAWSRGPTLASTPGSFTVRMQTEARATKRDVIAGLTDVTVAFVDVRTREEYEGATPYMEKRGGHLPRAVHLDWRTLHDDKGLLLRGEKLRERVRASGIDPSQKAIVYCTGGVRSALVTEVLRANGIDALNYDGSMWEWAADEKLPLVTGPAQKNERRSPK